MSPQVAAETRRLLRTLAKSLSAEELRASLAPTASDPGDSAAASSAARGAFLTLFAEAARHDSSEDEVRAYLCDQCHLESADAADLVAREYSAWRRRQPAGRGHVQCFPRPHIVDVRWKLAYQTGNTLQGRAAAGPLYLVELHTASATSASGVLRFHCELDELQDLVHRLKDTVKCLESFASGHGR